MHYAFQPDRHKSRSGSSLYRHRPRNGDDTGSTSHTGVRLIGKAEGQYDFRHMGALGSQCEGGWQELKRQHAKFRGPTAIERRERERGREPGGFSGSCGYIRGE